MGSLLIPSADGENYINLPCGQ